MPDIDSRAPKPQAACYQQQDIFCLKYVFYIFSGVVATFKTQSVTQIQTYDIIHTIWRIFVKFGMNVVSLKTCSSLFILTVYSGE